MANAAEQLFLQYDRDRRAAHAAAKRLADRIITDLHAVTRPNAFKSLDCDDLLRAMQDLHARHDEYIQADLALNRAAGEALKD